MTQKFEISIENCVNMDNFVNTGIKGTKYEAVIEFLLNKKK